jgi:hypothetical protein
VQHCYYIIDLLELFSNECVAASCRALIRPCRSYPMEVPPRVIVYALARLLLPASEVGEKFQARKGDELQQPECLGTARPNHSQLWMLFMRYENAGCSILIVYTNNVCAGCTTPSAARCPRLRISWTAGSCPGCSALL